MLHTLEYMSILPLHTLFAPSLSTVCLTSHQIIFFTPLFQSGCQATRILLKKKLIQATKRLILSEDVVKLVSWALFNEHLFSCGLVSS